MLASLGSFTLRSVSCKRFCIVGYLLLLGVLSCILSLGICYNSKVDVRRCWCCSIHKEPCLPLSTGKHSTLRMLQHAKTSDVGVWPILSLVVSINFLLAKIITGLISRVFLTLRLCRKLFHSSRISVFARCSFFRTLLLIKSC